MGHHLSRLEEPVFVAGPKPMRTEFGIHKRLESCVTVYEFKMTSLFVMIPGYDQQWPSMLRSSTRSGKAPSSPSCVSSGNFTRTQSRSRSGSSDTPTSERARSLTPSGQFTETETRNE